VLKFGGSLNLDDAALDTLLNAPGGDVGRYLRKKGVQMVAGAKRDVGVRTGALRTSITADVDRIPVGQRLTVSARTKYAFVHHQGSRPHNITMKLTSKRGRRYAKTITHPGTKPNHYLTKQLKFILRP
jgi:hypothetical protein